MFHLTFSTVLKYIFRAAGGAQLRIGDTGLYLQLIAIEISDKIPALHMCLYLLVSLQAGFLYTRDQFQPIAVVKTSHVLINNVDIAFPPLAKTSRAWFRLLIAKDCPVWLRNVYDAIKVSGYNESAVCYLWTTTQYQRRLASDDH